VMVPLWMWPMAVVCGNTFILKPSERDPSSALLVAQLAIDAGLPPGVLNVVNGDKEAVDAVLADKRIQAVSCVGSTPIGEVACAQAALGEGQGVCAAGRGRRGNLADRWPGRPSIRPSGRLLSGAMPVRQRQARHDDLPGRNLRPGAGRGARQDAAGGDGSDRP